MTPLPLGEYCAQPNSAVAKTTPQIPTVAEFQTELTFITSCPQFSVCVYWVLHLCRHVVSQPGRRSMRNVNLDPHPA